MVSLYSPVQVNMALSPSKYCNYYLMLCVSAEAEALNQFHSLCLTPQRPEPTIYHTRGEYTNHYTTYTV